LDGGEIIYERDAEKVSQPIADIMDDDDDDFLFLLEEDDESNDDATRQDRVFMNNVTRSLKKVSTQQSNFQDQNVVTSSHLPPCTEPQTASSRSSMIIIPTTMLTRVSLVPKHLQNNSTSQHLPIENSNKTMEKSKNSFKVSFWPSRSRAIANDNNTIPTFHEIDEFGSYTKSNEPTKQTSPSTIRKFTRVFGRLFVKSDVQ